MTLKGQLHGVPLDEADPTTPPPPKRRRRLIALAAMLATATAVAVPLTVSTGQSTTRVQSGTEHVPNASPSAPAPDLPTPKPGSITVHPLYAPVAGLEESPQRLLPKVSGPVGTGGYRFLRDGHNKVARWDPCRPIHYVVNPRYAPQGGGAAIVEAVNSVSQASGLKFVYDGTTSERPSADRERYQPDRYGDRFAPVLIAWSSPFEFSPLADDAIGYGGGIQYSANYSKPPALVSGSITLDALQLEADARAGFPDGTPFLIEHELGHVVGLDHVFDATQLMAPEGVLEHGLAAGDLRGLAEAGAGVCHPEM